MKKSTKKSISLGLAGVSVLSPVLDAGVSIYALSMDIASRTNFNWVASSNLSSKIELSNDTTTNNFWYYDSIDSKIHTKGGTDIEFMLDDTSLTSGTTISSIEVKHNGVVIGKSDNSPRLKLSLASIPSDSSVEVVYTLDSGVSDTVPLYDYFSSVTGSVVGHEVDDVAPTLTLSNKNTSNATIYNNTYYKGNIEYTFQSDVVNNLSPNVWGGNGYSYKLFINNTDYTSASTISTINTSNTTASGEFTVGVNLDNLSKVYDGKCDIDIVVCDNVGNESKYSDTVYLDYNPPEVVGSITANKWVDTVNGVTYFSTGDTVEVAYNVSDNGSGVKNISLLKDSNEILNSTNSTGSFIIDSESSYELKVEDNIGNVKVYSLSDFIPGVADIIKFDTTSPSISCNEIGLINNWFTSQSSITFDITDDVGLDSIKYTVNSTKKTIQLGGTTTSQSIVIDKSFLSTASTLDISVVARDVLGKETTYATSYNVDVTTPSLVNGRVVGDIKVVNGVGYAKNNLVIEGIAEDYESGIASLEVLKDGTVIDNKLPYVIYSDGDYSIRITDNVGHITELALEDIAGENFNGIVIDNLAPSVDVLVNGNVASSDWYTDSAVLEIISNDDKNIDYIKYVLNGQETVVPVNAKNYTLSIRLEDYINENGVVDFSYTVVDDVGNESVYSKVFRVDTSTPTINNARLDGSITMVGNTAYANGSLVLSADILDKESNIDTVEILKDGKVVGDTLPFTIDKDGAYSIRVRDGVGHEVVKTLSDLTNLNIDNVVIDSGKPSIDVKVNALDVKDDWYMNRARLVINASDTNIKSVRYSINGVTTEKTVGSSNDTLEIDLEDYVTNTGLVDFEYSVVDYVGNESTFSKVFKVDTVKPSISNTMVSGNYYMLGNIAFIKDGITLSADITDNESGVAKVEVLKNNQVIATSLPYTIVENGMYAIRVTDNAGQVVTKKLKDLTKDGIDNVVVDSTAPSIGVSVNGLDVADNWYKDTATLKVDVSDSSSINNIKYSINGVETSNIVNSTTYSSIVDLENFVDNKGKVEFSYEAVDVLGNKSTYSNIFKIDTKNPNIINSKLDGSFNTLNGVGYTNNSLVLSADVGDEESGVALVEVVRNSQVISNSLPYKIDKSGIYEIKVTDSVGHSSTKRLKELVGVDSIVVDTNAPSVNVNVNGDVVKDTWYKGMARLTINSSDTSPIKSIKCSVNGVDIQPNVNDEIVVDLEKFVDNNGLVSVEYEVVDYADNVSKYSKVLKIDTKSPIISNGRLDGNMKIENGVAYINNNLILSADVLDNESGVELVEIVKDGVVVSNSLPYSIEENGVYELRVTDSVGYTTVKSIKELTNLDISTILMDKTTPTISRLEGFKEDLKLNNENWYSSTPKLKVAISDKNLDSVSIKVNDNEVINTISKDGNYIIPLNTTEGAYNVSISATDKSNNTIKDEYNFKVDLGTPSIANGVVSGEYTPRDYGLYFSSNPSISLKGMDSGTGVKEYILLDKNNNNEISRNSTGEFTVSSGEYYAKVVDYFGRESSVVSLQDVCGLESNRIVVDGVSPVILTSRPEGGIDGWFNKNIVYNIDVLDNIGINNAKVYINDVLVDSFIANKDVERTSLKADTSSVYKQDGKYTIKVIVEDNTGLVSEWADTIHIDTEPPKVLSGSILGSYVDRGDCLVFPSNPSVQVSVSDNGIGIKDIVIVDSQGVKSSSLSGLFKLSSDEYSIVVEDKLGNTSKPITLKDICNIPSNKIVVDTDKPLLTVDKPNGISGNWYKDDVPYNLSLKDSVGLQNVKVVINGVNVIDKKFENLTLSNDLAFSTKGVNPNKDGSYNVSITVTDLVGNTSSWSDVVYVDKFAPVVDKFIINGKGYIEGANINSSDKYGFFIQGSTDIEVHISDGSYSSGVDTLYYDLVKYDGSIKEGKASIVNGIAKINIGENFKGYISAYAVDRVGNKGIPNRPDGIVSEEGNTSINSSKIDMTLPNTNYKDIKGNALYSEDINIQTSISDSVSGIRKISWGIGDDTKGVANINTNGVLSGDTGSVSKKDKNLVVDVSKVLPILGNSNDINVWVEVEDRVGNISRNSRSLSIDKDAPVITVSYDNNNPSSFYNKTRVAKVTIKERNFRSSDVKFQGVYGEVGTWVNIGDDTWECEVVFSEDNDYQWSVDYTDMAGNKAKAYISEKFTVDRTAPVLSVSFDNNKVENSNYYKDSRIATITVVDKNFNPSLVKLNGSGNLEGWSSNGDTHTSKIVFDKDGEYKFSLDVEDKAGNKASRYESSSFIIDKTLPSLNITGVQNGISYKKNTSFKVNIGDANIDKDKCSVTLSGRSIGNIELIGGINGETGEFTFAGVPEEIKYDDLYTIKAVVTDKAGNVVEKTLNYSINRFGSRFAFLDTHLLNNISRSAKTVVLEETSVDRLDINNCKVVIIRDGQSIPVDSKYVKIEETGGVDGHWVYKYVISKEVFDTDGKYQVQVFSKSLDGSSNSSLSQEYPFILDTTKPEVIISGVEDGSSYRGVNCKVAVDVRDLSGIKYIKAYLNGTEVELSNEGGIYYVDVPENDKKQQLVVEVMDKAGNLTKSEVKDFVVTSNILVSVVNSSLAKGILGGLGVVGVFFASVLIRRRKTTKLEELELAQEHAKMYNDSIKGSSSNSNDSLLLEDDKI